MLEFLKKKTKEDEFINNLPLHPDLKKEGKGAFFRLKRNDYTDETLKANDLQLVRDMVHLSIQKGSEDVNNKFYPYNGGLEVVGYKPAGSYLRKLYPNDFTLHCFLAEAYWAAAKARKELWVEIDRDGYVLTASSSVSKKTIKMIYKVLEDLKVPYYRNKIRDNLLISGNAVMQNVYNKFGGLIKLNPLVMEKVAPAYNLTYDYLEGWQYIWGNRPTFIPYDDADHLYTYNARSNILGAPALGSAIVDVEAALQAAIYNNNVMQKGGLLSVVFRLKDPKNSDLINDKVSFGLADEFTKWLERRFGGIRGAGQLAFIPMVEGVDVLNKVGEMDSAWTNLDHKTAQKVALLFGVPPERIGVARTSQYENKELVTDALALSFDNNNYYVTNIVDEYLTKVIIKDGLGIDNVKIEMAGEFSAISKVAAEVGQMIAAMGTDVMTVDQFRQDLMHIEPLGGEEGKKYLGNYFRQMKDSNEEAPLTRAVGQAKHFLPEYQEIKANKVRHSRKEIPFY